MHYKLCKNAQIQCGLKATWALFWTWAIGASFDLISLIQEGWLKEKDDVSDNFCLQTVFDNMNVITLWWVIKLIHCMDFRDWLISMHFYAASF